MRFVGSTTWDWEGKTAFRVRNKTVVYIVPCRNFLDNTGKDPRYFELYMDFAGKVWCKRPAGSQVELERPYTVLTLKGDEVESKEVS